MARAAAAAPLQRDNVADEWPERDDAAGFLPVSDDEPAGDQAADIPLDTGKTAPDCASMVLSAATARLHAEWQKPLKSGLYVTATPIGNLGDMSLRALAILGRVAAVACEDTRKTGWLLSQFGIKARLIQYGEHSASKNREEILGLIGASAVALVSDAGTPLLSDPGFKLVRAARAAGHDVFAVPGASAAAAALSIAGLPTDTFHFVGFLPSRSAARRARIAELDELPGTLAIYEAARRLPATLRDLHDGLGDRPAAICAELTKLHERVLLGSLSELVANTGEQAGETVVLVGAATASAAVPDDATIIAALRAHPQSGRDAIELTARALGLKRKLVYAIYSRYNRERY